MGSYPLDRPKILKILDKAGPALLQKLCIEPVFMAYLVQADILSHEDSQTISSKEGPIYQCQALLSHLRQASVDKFIDFCFVLIENAMKQEVVTEVFGLTIEDLKRQKEGTRSRKRTASPQSYSEYGVEVYIELRVKRMKGDHAAYEVFKRTLQDTLRHNSTGSCRPLEDLEDDVNALTKALINKGRKAMEITSGCVVFRMYCPTLESLQDLHTLCTSGQLACMAENIFTNHHAFTEFGLDDVSVEITIDEEEFARCTKQFTEQDGADESETVILSVVGHYNQDPSGTVLLDNLLTEQIKQLIPDATILHVVLEDQQKIIADGQQHSFVGYNKAGAPSSDLLPPSHSVPSPDSVPSPNSRSSSDSRPPTDFLNGHTKDCYGHLIKHRVSHIIGYAPEFIAGAINIKVDLFPNAALIMMINDQIDMQWNGDRNLQPGDDIVKWSQYAEGLVTIGRQTYNDVESMLSAIDDPSSECNSLMYYIPCPPLQLSQQKPWSKPPDTLNPVILILAGSIEAQEQQNMVLPMVVNAINAVAEDLSEPDSVGQIAIRISGIPENEQNQLMDDLRAQSPYTSLACVNASSFSELSKEMENCHVCILPFGCATHSYGLEFITSTGFGVPTLVPDSVGCNFDVKEIMPTDDQQYLKEMVVQVVAAKSQQEEEQAWMEKIRYTLLNSQLVETNANAPHQVIHNSDVVKKSQQDFFNLIQAPTRKGILWRALSDDPWCPYKELDYENMTYIEQANGPSGPMNFPAERTRLQYEHFHSQRPDLDLEVIRPNNKKIRFLKLWVFMIRCIQPVPLVDVMLAQGSINYVIHKEVHDRVKTHDQYAAMRGLIVVGECEG